MRKVLLITLALTGMLTLTAYATESQADILSGSVAFLIECEPVPTFGSEWTMLALAKSGLELPDNYVETYYENVEQYVVEQEGVLHHVKYTEYARLVMALTAWGYDPTNVAGYDMVKPLTEYDKVTWQGVNGAIWALLALNQGSYESETCEGYVTYILDSQLDHGGWSLFGEVSDPDVTAMAVQGLVRYRSREEVETAMTLAVECLAEIQQTDGTFASNGVTNLESVAQVMLALDVVGVDFDDQRFVKEENTLGEVLLTYKTGTGGFAHELGGNTDLIATQQAMMALSVSIRAQEHESSERVDTDNENSGIFIVELKNSLSKDWLGLKQINKFGHFMTITT